MLVEAGEENAGLVDIGDGLACAFKIESSEKLHISKIVYLNEKNKLDYHHFSDITSHFLVMTS